MIFWGSVLTLASSLGFAFFGLAESLLGGEGFQPHAAISAGLIGLLFGLNFALLTGLIITLGRRPMTREGTAIATFIVAELCFTITMAFTWRSRDGSPFIEDLIGSSYLGFFPSLLIAVVAASLPSGFYRPHTPSPELLRPQPGRPTGP